MLIIVEVVMSIAQKMDTLFAIMGIAFFLFYAYQFGYLIIGLIQKRRRKKESPKADSFQRYAAVISARNEERVIGTLLKSLKNQNYPQDKLDIYVIADNCTDDTARVARENGAIVYERFNRKLQGKGYALDYLYTQLKHENKRDYDGYFVFDADNVIDKNFVLEMNRLFSTGEYGALTGYRNSTNFAKNWITSGYAIWFLREARFLNSPRMRLGSNCHVSGTGFLVSGKIIEENDGWPYFLLTEDIQFSVDCAIKGIRVGYCENAVFYDEQPETFKQSWNQRMRWSKGFYQVDGQYAPSLVSGIFHKHSKAAWSCYDMLATVMPGTLLLIAYTLVCIGVGFLSAELTDSQIVLLLSQLLASTMRYLLDFYIMMFAYALITVICEWKMINASSARKLLYTLTFPFFMLTYIPISLLAFFKKVSWTPISHYGNSELAKNV